MRSRGSSPFSDHPWAESNARWVSMIAFRSMLFASNIRGEQEEETSDDASDDAARNVDSILVRRLVTAQRQEQSSRHEVGEGREQHTPLVLENSSKNRR